MRGREPLWKVKDQAARLAELVSHAGDLKEAPLHFCRAGRNAGFAIFQHQAQRRLFESPRILIP